MKDKYVGGEKMARNFGKMAKRKICVLFKFPDFNTGSIKNTFWNEKQNKFDYSKINSLD